MVHFQRSERLTEMVTTNSPAVQVTGVVTINLKLHTVHQHTGLQSTDRAAWSHLSTFACIKAGMCVIAGE